MILRNSKNQFIEILNEAVLSYNSIFLEFYELYNQRENKESFKQNGDFIFLKIIELLEKNDYKSLQKKERKKVEVHIIKEIRKLSSEFSSQKTIDLKLIHTISNAMFEYLNNKQEISIDKTLHIACYFMENILNTREKKYYDLIQKGKISFEYIVSNFNRLNEVLEQEQVSSFLKRIDVKEDTIFKNDLIEVYFPSSYRNFMKILKESGYDNGTVDWCTKERGTWFSYNRDQRVCILVKKNIQDKKDPNRLISLKISKGDRQDDARILYEYSCDARNNYMTKHSFIKENIFTNENKTDNDNNLIASESFAQIESEIVKNASLRPLLFERLKQSDILKDVKSYKKVLSSLVTFKKWEVLLECLNFSYSLDNTWIVDENQKLSRSASSEVTFKVLVKLYEKTNDKKIIELFLTLISENTTCYDYFNNNVSNFLKGKNNKKNLFLSEVQSLIKNSNEKSNFNFLKDTLDQAVFLLSDRNVSPNLMRAIIYLLCNTKEDFNASFFDKQNFNKIIINILNNDNVFVVHKAISSIYSSEDVFKLFIEFFKSVKDEEKFYNLNVIKKIIEDKSINLSNLEFSFINNENNKDTIDTERLQGLITSGTYTSPLEMIMLYYYFKNKEKYEKAFNDLSSAGKEGDIQNIEIQLSLLTGDNIQTNGIDINSILKDFISNNNFISFETFKDIMLDPSSSKNMMTIFDTIGNLNPSILNKILEEDPSHRNIIDFFNNEESVIFSKFIIICLDSGKGYSSYNFYNQINDNEEIKDLKPDIVKVIIECCLFDILALKGKGRVLEKLSTNILFDCVNYHEEVASQFSKEILNVILHIIYTFDIEYISDTQYTSIGNLNSDFISQELTSFINYLSTSNNPLLHTVYTIIYRFFDPYSKVQSQVLQNEDLKVEIIVSWMLRYDKSKDYSKMKFDDSEENKQRGIINDLIVNLNFNTLSRENTIKMLSTFKSYFNKSISSSYFKNDVKSQVINVIIRMLENQTNLEGLHILGSNRNIYLMFTAILLDATKSKPSPISLDSIQLVLEYDTLLKNIFDKNSDLEEKLIFIKKMQVDIQTGNRFMKRLFDELINKFTRSPSSIHSDFHEELSKIIEEKELARTRSVRKKIDLYNRSN